MADDQKQRFYRSSELPRRGASATPSTSSTDPLAELARLIGQTDPFGEYARENARRATPPSVAPAPPPSFGPADYFDASDAPPQPLALQEPAYAGRARQPYDGAGSYSPAHEAVGVPVSEAEGYEPAPYHPSEAQVAPEDETYDEGEQPAKKGNALAAIATVFAMALIGTAGAFGYHTMFRTQAWRAPPVIKADTAPSKIVPATSNKTPNKLIYDRVADRAQDEKLVSREEQPVEIKPADIKTAAPPATVLPPQASAPPAAPQPGPGSGVVTTEPKKVHTIAIRADQADGGVAQPAAAAPTPPPATPAQVKQAPPLAPAVSNPPLATTPAPPPRPTDARAAAPERHAAEPASRNAPLSLSPGAEPARTPTRTASMAAPEPKPTAMPHGYSVQVSSQRSEAEAQAAYRSLQTKYPNLLGSRQAMIRKVDLGSKGTYYRALVGPFASATEATELCGGLKASGGQCVVQRN